MLHLCIKGLGHIGNCKSLCGNAKINDHYTNTIECCGCDECIKEYDRLKKNGEASNGK